MQCSEQGDIHKLRVHERGEGVTKSPHEYKNLMYVVNNPQMGEEGGQNWSTWFMDDHQGWV